MTRKTKAPEDVSSGALLTFPPPARSRPYGFKAFSLDTELRTLPARLRSRTSMPQTPPEDSDSRHGPRVASLLVAYEHTLTEPSQMRNQQTCCGAAGRPIGRPVHALSD